jgi:ATP-dependent RNA helicase DHX37/DHR1
VFKLLAVIGASEHANSLESFCSKRFLRVKALREIHQLRAQITSIAQSTIKAEVKAGEKMKTPSDKQVGPVC